MRATGQANGGCETRRTQTRVETTLALELTGTCGGNPFARRLLGGERLSTIVPASMFGEISAANRLEHHPQIESVEQRPGQAAAIPFDERRLAEAARGASPVVATGTGIHCRDELKTGRVIRLRIGTGHGNLAGFERFAQRFEHAAVEFGQLVEKQDAVMREGDLAR